MNYIDRHNTYSVKYDDLKARYGRDDLIPLWVADMDFETPVCVRKALQKIIDKGVYGYNIIPSGYYNVIRDWLATAQNWSVSEEWLTFIPGIVKGIGYVVNYFTHIGDGIIVQPPVYPPFMSVPHENGRNLLFNPLIRLKNGSYEMDFNNLCEIGRSGKAKLLILCNPHNPGGIRWSSETLSRLAEICFKYKILVVSDEIHADMQLWGNTHIPFASVSAIAQKISITFGAPSKTFNMAGIVSSYAVVPNNQIREPFYKWLRTNELNAPTIFATVGTIAAYIKGDPWRRAMLKYIEDNILVVEEQFKNTDLIKPIRPDASFLIWLDCRELSTMLAIKYPDKLDEVSGDRQRLLVDFFVNRTRLALNDGATFGHGGEGYMRMNIGTGREIIGESLQRILSEISSLV